MSPRTYTIRLAVLLLIFVVVIPGGTVGLFYSLEDTPGSANTALGFGYVAFFLGIPLWIIGLAIALWRLTRPRVMSLGLPHVVSLCFIPLVLADWMTVLSFFRDYRAWFLIGAAVMLIALIFWPTRDAQAGDEPRSMTAAREAAIGSFIIHALLATLSVIGSFMTIWTYVPLVYSLQFSTQRIASMWIFVVVAAQIWVIVEGWRRKSEG